MLQKTLPPILTFTHTLASNRIQAGDTVIDATMGNGHDTLFLCRQLGPGGQVIAMDVQQAAINSTRALLNAEKVFEEFAEDGIVLLDSGHEHMQEIVAQHARKKPSIIMFNLGYLPGADKSVTTVTETSLEAIRQSLEVIDLHGVLLIVVYTGHEQGWQEHEALQAFFAQLDSRYFLAAQYGLLNLKDRAPYLVAIEKIREVE